MRVSQGGQGWYHSNDSRTSRSAKLIVICNSGDGRFWHRTTGCARNTVRSKLGGHLPRSTSVPRLAALGCACSVREAGLRRVLLTRS